MLSTIHDSIQVSSPSLIYHPNVLEEIDPFSYKIDEIKVLNPSFIQAKSIKSIHPK